jgi:hypothetical protein
MLVGRMPAVIRELHHDLLEARVPAFGPVVPVAWRQLVGQDEAAVVALDFDAATSEGGSASEQASWTMPTTAGVHCWSTLGSVSRKLRIAALLS